MKLRIGALIGILFHLSCNATESGAQQLIAPMAKVIVSKAPKKRKMRGVKKKYGNSKEKKIKMSEDKMMTVVLGRRTLTELEHYFPQALAQEIFGYSGCEDGEFIPYYNPCDNSYVRTTRMPLSNLGISSKRKLYDIATSFQILGTETPHYSCAQKGGFHLPIVRNCQFSNTSFVRELNHWDYERIGNIIRRSFHDASDKIRFFDHSDSFDVRAYEQCPSLTQCTVSMMRLLLGESNIVAKERNSSAVVEGQQNSLFCGVPGMGPHELAQLLKNAALCLKDARARLHHKRFADQDRTYGAELDDLVDRYPQYQPILDVVIADETDTLMLVFFNKDKTLEDCMKMLSEVEKPALQEPVVGLKDKDWAPSRSLSTSSAMAYNASPA